MGLSRDTFYLICQHCCGRTLMETLDDGKQICKEKLIG
jgi:hypothetical protein